MASTLTHFVIFQPYFPTFDDVEGPFLSALDTGADFFNKSGKVDHVGGMAADLWLSKVRINVRLSGQHKCH